MQSDPPQRTKSGHQGTHGQFVLGPTMIVHHIKIKVILLRFSPNERCVIACIRQSPSILPCGWLDTRKNLPAGLFCFSNVFFSFFFFSHLVPDQHHSFITQLIPFPSHIPLIVITQHNTYSFFKEKHLPLQQRIARIS